MDTSIPIIKIDKFGYDTDQLADEAIQSPLAA
jgi:hypothetical protein